MNKKSQDDGQSAKEIREKLMQKTKAFKTRAENNGIIKYMDDASVPSVADNEERKLNFLIHKMYKEGWDRVTAREFCMKPVEEGGWGYKTSYTSDLIRKANLEVKELMQKTIIDAYSSQLAVGQAFFYDMLSKGKYYVAADLYKELNKIMGLHTERVEIKTDVIVKTSWGIQPNDTSNNNTSYLDASSDTDDIFKDL